MEYQFSESIMRVGPSPIREAFKYMGKEGYISFGGGSPDNRSFPVKEMDAIAHEIFATMPYQALQYSSTEGYGPLRQDVAGRLRERFGIDCAAEDICITTGGQQALDLLARTLIDPGDEVICEAPSFTGALNAFRVSGAELVSVPMDEDGMDAAALDRTLQAHPKVKFIYLIPTFQNPSGRTMSAARRKDIYDVARRHNTLIVEDNPYGELRFRGEDVKPIKSLDVTGHVVYVGSFSKILAPGVRLGFLCAPAEILQKVVIAKQVADSHTNIFFQILASKFMREYDLDVHVSKIAALYREKCEVMEEAIQKYFPDTVSVTHPDGGMFLWCTMPEGVDERAITAAAIEHQIVVIPGAAFRSEADHASPAAIRLNFSMPQPADIEEGVRRLAQALKEVL